jgi:isoquinoline 1-oxidoreductase/isoquinoline 1-oxidoreductase beta subunit
MTLLHTSRRNLIKTALTGAGSLSLAVSLPGCQSLHTNALQDDGIWEANAWLEITPANQLIFTLDRVEMGQGTYTGLTTLVAEELDTPPEEFEIRFAPADPAYRNKDYGLQLTGGSNSLSSSWQALRETGALAKLLLIRSASDVLQVPESHLIIRNKHVVHITTNKKLSFGSLVAIAAKQSVPSDIPLKAKSDFIYIVKQKKRLDSHLKVSGRAQFGIDVDIPGMRYAVVSRAPFFGVSPITHNGDAIKQLPGVENVLLIQSGVAIIAANYWQARKAQQQLIIEWSVPEQAPQTLEDVFTLYRQAASDDQGDSKRSEGSIKNAFKAASSVMDAEFTTPFLAHATMEPMNCTAHVQSHRVDIWTSTQAPDVAAVAAAKVTDVALSDIHIHNQFIGGGFGRRLSQDFVAEAAEISAKAGGVIKLIWSREEDTQHDLYRPASLHKIRVALDDKGMPAGWDHQIVAPNIMDWYIWDASPAMFPWSPKFMYSTLGKVGLLTAGTPITPADTSAYEGADDIPYNIPSIEVRHTKADAGIPVSYWRSVGHSHTAFAVESMISEIAERANMDEFTFRQHYLQGSPRALAVLEKVAEIGNWGQNPKDTSFQGIAVHKSFGSYVAELVELEITNGEIKLLKVFCVIDCGLVVNPDIVRMQMESCIIFGATAALYGEITLEDGKIKQSNFHDYPLMRMDQAPEIEVHIIDSDASSTGVGEPGLPPLAPAIASALYKATGKRYRNLPFRLA